VAAIDASEFLGDEHSADRWGFDAAIAAHALAAVAAAATPGLASATARVGLVRLACGADPGPVDGWRLTNRPDQTRLDLCVR
jgi:hypothetical protein